MGKVIRTISDAAPSGQRYRVTGVIRFAKVGQTYGSNKSFIIRMNQMTYYYRRET